MANPVTRLEGNLASFIESIASNNSLQLDLSIPALFKPTEAFTLNS
jgi:hypothetical protein